MSEKKTFEEKLNRLNEIVSKIEGETLMLKQSIALYQEGKKLIQELEKELEEAEARIGDLKVDSSDVK